MLEVQKFLQDNNGDFTLLEKTLGITSNFHEDGRVILNYDQVKSPKLDLIVRECRALTLNRYDYSLIAKSFSRFLNWGEGTRNEMNRFNWNKCWTTEKVDGSLISYFYWNNKWHVQTRNSYGYGYINNTIYTWREVFDIALNKVELEPVLGRNHVFELCSPYNQIVKIYNKPTLYLLSIFDGEIEWNHEAVDSFAKEHNLNRPFSVECKDPFEVNSEVARQSELEKQFEGLVARDCSNNRFKFKNPIYLQLSHLTNNGNLINIKHIVPIILKGEQDEMIAYFPYIEETLRKVEKLIDSLIKEIDNYWFTFCIEKSRKQFAIDIQKCPLNGLLFSVYGKKYEEVNIRELMLINISNVIEYINNRILAY